MARERSERSACPIGQALDIFGDRWTLLIVRDLAFSQRSRYRDFLKAGERIATNILADRLQRLEAAGIISRGAKDSGSGHQSYTLTERGIDLVPILFEMLRWRVKHDPNTVVSEDYQARLEQDSAQMARDLQAKLRGDLA